MHDQRTSHDEKTRNRFLTPAEEDAQMEGAVLALLLDQHPTRPTIPELRRELVGETEEFATNDAVERAVRDLGGAGLVRLEDFVAVPTRAALRFNDLLGEEL